MGASSACCENLPQMPGRSSLVLFLACSSETNTTLRQFSVHLTFQAEDPGRNHFPALTPTPATFRLWHHLLFPLKSFLWGEDNALQATQLSSLCAWYRWESVCTQGEKWLPGTPIHHQKSSVQALLSPELYWTNWEPLKDSQTEVLHSSGADSVMKGQKHGLVFVRKFCLGSLAICLFKLQII